MNALESILAEWVQSDHDFNNIFPFIKCLIDNGIDLDSPRSETSPLIVTAAAPAKTLEEDGISCKNKKHKQHFQAVQMLLDNGSSIEAREPVR
jgi:hypothetical protein